MFLLLLLLLRTLPQPKREHLVNGTDTRWP